mgnify:FL=1
MKMKVIRVNATNRSGTSKSGNPYHIDQTEITVQVPYSSPEGFGFKEMTYQYGDSSQIAKLMPLRDNLPAECDIDLGVSLNSYGSTQTIVTDIKLPQTLAKA